MPPDCRVKPPTWISWPPEDIMQLYLPKGTAPPPPIAAACLLRSGCAAAASGAGTSVSPGGGGADFASDRPGLIVWLSSSIFQLPASFFSNQRAEEHTSEL